MVFSKVGFDMNFNDYRFLLIISALAVFLLLLFSIPFRKKNYSNKAGKNLVKTSENKKYLMNYLSIIFAAFLIAILFFRNLGFVYNLIICLVALLAVYMGTEEIVLNGLSGLYENALIGNGKYLSLSEIFVLPVLSYSKEEQAALDQRILVITTEKKGSVNFIFSSEDEKNFVENQLLKLKPELCR